MTEIIKRKFMSLTEILHLKIFGHEMGEGNGQHVKTAFDSIFYLVYNTY